MRIWLLAFAFMCVGFTCSPLKYKSDHGFMVAAQANSPEQLVMIGGKACVDLDQVPGLCSKRHRRNLSLFMSIPERPYNYRMELRCSANLDSNQQVDILKNQNYVIEIKPDKFGPLKSFICIGEIFPHGRDSVSSKWEVRVKLVNKDYVPREGVYLGKYKGKSYLVVGKHALYTSVFQKGKWKKYKKKPTIRVRDPENLKAYSESYNMRFNYYGF